MDDLDNLLFAEIEKLSLDPDYIENTVQEKNDETVVINQEIEKLTEQMNRIMDLYAIGEMPVELLQKRVRDLSEKKTKLTDRLYDLEKENSEKLSTADTMELIRSFGDILKRGDYDEIRSVIGALINRVELDGKDVTIYWNFQ